MDLKISRRPQPLPLTRTTVSLGGPEGMWLLDPELGVATKLTPDARHLFATLAKARMDMTPDVVCATSKLSRIRTYEALEILVLARSFEGLRSQMHLDAKAQPNELTLAGVALSPEEAEALRAEQAKAIEAATPEEALLALVTPLVALLEIRELRLAKAERFARRASLGVPAAPDVDQMARFAGALASLFAKVSPEQAAWVEALFQKGELPEFKSERIAEVFTSCQGLRPDLVVQTASAVFMLVTEAHEPPTALTSAQIVELFVHDLGALLSRHGPRPWPQWLQEFANQPHRIPLSQMTPVDA